MIIWLKKIGFVSGAFVFVFSSSYAVEVAAPAVVERGPHHAVWQRVTQRTTDYGRKYYVTNSYQELASGLNYWRENQWVESREQIEIVQGAAIARQGQHQAAFAP